LTGGPESVNYKLRASRPAVQAAPKGRAGWNEEGAIGAIPGSAKGLSRLFRPSDDESGRRTRVFALTWILAAVSSTGFLVQYGLLDRSYDIAPLLPLEAAAIASLLLFVRGRRGMAATLLSWSLLLCIMGLAALNEGVRDTALSAYPALLILAALLLGPRSLVLIAMIFLFSLAALGALQLGRVLVYPSAAAISFSDLFDILVIDLATTLVVILVSFVLRSDLARRMEVESRLRESEGRFRLVLENSQDALYKRDLASDSYEYLSPVFKSISGYSPEEFKRLSYLEVQELTHPEDRPAALRVAEESSSGAEGTPYSYDFRFKRADGVYRWFLDRFIVMKDGSGRPAARIGSVSDITDRKEAEARIARSLEEKETLLRELYHRTHNNMTVIIALLDMQASASGDERLAAAFAEAQNRIRSMALAHQMLYEARDLSRVDLKKYVADLVSHLAASYGASAGRIAIELELDEATILIDNAIPCGLALNELVSNALKHGFPEGRSGAIRVGLSRSEGGDIRLELSDDGVGAPPGFDFRRDARLGLQTAYSLVERQLNGRILLDLREGVAWRIEFRDDIHSPRF
jgi:PAS domain S-box-containing protein